jgi:hypothetical protein
MLIHGDSLTPAQRDKVLRAFAHRWTFENARQNYHNDCPACVQHRQCNGTLIINGRPFHQIHARLTSDAEWLSTHAFHFLKDGSRLMLNHRYAVAL